MDDKTGQIDLGATLQCFSLAMNAAVTHLSDATTKHLDETRLVQQENLKLQSDMQAVATEMDELKSTHNSEIASKEKDLLELRQETADLKKQVEHLLPYKEQVISVARADAAPSSNLKKDDDGIITAPECPEASGENKAGKEAVPTLRVLVEERGTGAEAGASNKSEDGKASPSSVHGLHAKADEGGGEELEAEGELSKRRALCLFASRSSLLTLPFTLYLFPGSLASKSRATSQDDADNLKLGAEVELARRGSEKKKERNEAKEKARVWSENRKKTPKKTKAVKKTTAKRRRSARGQKGDVLGTLWESED